jgi:SAM-dependent methyltransferase
MSPSREITIAQPNVPIAEAMSSIGGNVADVGYTAGFYPETAPAHLAFAALCRSRAPGLAGRPRRVLELGFGQGFGLALLAAANPDVAFEGCDFNAEHVAHARHLIGDAMLANVSVSHQSFEQAADQGDNDVDVVILHGILSWIEPASQRAVVSNLERRLKPGGVAYVSYNCMPGWAPLAPIRRLILDVKHHNPGSSANQIGPALDLLEQLWRSNAGYFVMNPMAAHHVLTMLAMDQAYLAHEFLAEPAALPYFADVAAQLAPAGLAFAASAALLDNFDVYAAPATVRPIIDQIGDPILRETVRDFAANRKFRRDIFSRGTHELAPDERRRMLSALRFTLAVPRRRLTLKFLGPVGDLNLNPEFHEAVADVLAQQIATFDALLALPVFKGQVDHLIDCLALLVYSGQVLPVPNEGNTDVRAAQRFNRVVAERARAGRFYGHLAVPIAGTGIPVDEIGLLALGTMFDGEADPATAAAQALATLSRLGRRPRRENVPIEDDRTAAAFLTERMVTVFAEQVPLWQRLGVL